MSCSWGVDQRPSPVRGPRQRRLLLSSDDDDSADDGNQAEDDTWDDIRSDGQARSPLQLGSSMLSSNIKRRAICHVASRNNLRLCLSLLLLRFLSWSFLGASNNAVLVCAAGRVACSHAILSSRSLSRVALVLVY